MTEQAQPLKNAGSLTDSSLISAAIAGQKEAREQLARACVPRVRRLVMFSLSNKNDLDDVIQVALVHIFKDLSSLRNPAGFIPWSDRVTLNAVRTHGRRRIRFQLFHTHVEETDSFAGHSESPEDTHARHALFTRLRTHLDRIRPNKRDAAVLSVFFGYVDTEIAEMVGCSVETAKKRTQHGRLELLRMLRNDPAGLELLKEAAR